MPEASQEQTTPEPLTVKALSGFDEGTVLSDGSVVRGDRDENGVLTGWHKEDPSAPSEEGEI